MKKIFLLAAATVMLTACSSSDDNYIDEPVAAQISATIGKSTDTRASETLWAQRDKIGVTMDDRYVNLEYTTEAGDGIFKGTTMYFKNKREPVTLTAYYPFKGPESKSPVLEATTSAQNQTSEKQQEFDFLYDRKTGVTGAEPNVQFTFSHQMSKLTLTFKNGNGADVSKISKYSIEGLVLEGTFNTATGIAAAKSGAAAQPLSFSGTEVKSGVATAPLILFPQPTAGKTVTLKITDSENQDYLCELKFKDDELASGNNYQWTITVNKTGLTVGESTIAEWNDQDMVNAGANSDLS